MLGRAVQDHHPGLPGFKGTTLSQQYQANSKANALKPVPPAALNAALPSWSQQKNPLKRTASQVNGTQPPHGSQEQRSNKNLAMSSSTAFDGGRVGKLHQTVFFDENDFEDDANIDLDEDDSPTLGKASPPQSFRTPVPDIMSRESTSTLLGDSDDRRAGPPKTPASSTPLPWSSSPDIHHEAQSRVQPSSIKSSSKLPAVQRTKRRTLPWLNESQSEPKSSPEDQQSHQRLAQIPQYRNNISEVDSSKGTKKAPIPEYVAGKIQQARAGKAQRQTAGEEFTPLPKDKSHSKFPWNTTASAIKAQQKLLRQGHRKPRVNGLSVKDRNDLDPVTRPKRQQATVAKVFLSDEQSSVLDLVTVQNKSVFFTGSAGTGKSVLLREIIKVCRGKFAREPDRLAVTASTGLAACNIGGVTLHSFAGIGLGKEAVPELVKKIKRNPKAKQRWLRTKVLIVDEISMVDGDLFDKLESIGRSIRNNGRPFGGIQLVITGDFFQLPPVPEHGRVSKFSFDAATWNTSIEHTIGLTQIFRQKDPVFANMLNEMRLGKLTPKSISAFRAMNRPLSFGDDFEATELFPTRTEVDNANGARMKNLVGKEYEFRAEDGGSIQDPEQRSKLLASCMAPATISLKKGAQVMLIKNLDDTLVNGSVGRVLAFMDERMFEYYDENEEDFQAVETMDLDDKAMTASRMKLKQMINKDLAGDTGHKWPVVRFSLPDGTTRDLLCQRESWKIELPNGEVQASRSQVPLILAWALSIHKAQGQTLERVKVDLGKIFEKGQAYVALSRATNQEGLQIMRFDPKKVMAHDRVRGFYDSLYSINKALESKAPADMSKNEDIANAHRDNYVDAVFDEDHDAMQAMYGN